MQLKEWYSWHLILADDLADARLRVLKGLHRMSKLDGEAADESVDINRRTHIGWKSFFSEFNVINYYLNTNETGL